MVVDHSYILLGDEHSFVFKKKLPTDIYVRGTRFDPSPYPICSMVLVYLPTKLGDLCWANVGKHSIHGAYGYG
jgi:hypothetical protein